jgi:hypothetical protein
VPTFREALVQAIRRILQTSRIGSTADVASQLNSTGRVARVEIEDVDSVLCSELAGEVAGSSKDGWTVKSSFARLIHERTENRLGADADPGLRAALRTIHRLRSGLPPREKIMDLTTDGSGYADVVTTFLGELDLHKVSRCLTFVGNYGEGKSHALSLVVEAAQANGFATCELCGDSSAVALNHPQRFLSLLFSSLQFPPLMVHGYEDFLDLLLSSEDGLPTVQKTVRRWLNRGRELDMDAATSLTALAQSYGRSADSAHLNMLKGRVSYYLAGGSIRHRSATAGVRELSYALLAIALDLLKSCGARGIVLAIDEVESIFTKLPNIRSRLGALRVLSALCASDELADVRVALGITPDAAASLLRMVREESLGSDGLHCEPLERLAKVLNSSGLKTWCTSLDMAERAELLERLRRLYLKAYPVFSIAAGPRTSWRRFAADETTSDVPVRVLIRKTIDFLDLTRYTTLPEAG